jgi:hypothetical protein
MAQSIYFFAWSFSQCRPESTVLIDLQFTLEVNDFAPSYAYTPIAVAPGKTGTPTDVVFSVYHLGKDSSDTAGKIIISGTDTSNTWGALCASTTVLPVGKKTHVHWLYTTSKSEIYFDGVLVGCMPSKGPLKVPSYPYVLTLGGVWYNSGGRFHSPLNGTVSVSKFFHK